MAVRSMGGSQLGSSGGSRLRHWSTKFSGSTLGFGGRSLHRWMRNINQHLPGPFVAQCSSIGHIHQVSNVRWVSS